LAYGDWNAAYNTGRGISLTFDAAPVAGQTKFDWAVKNDYSVDVSTAAKASTYMTNVTTNLDAVNSALSTLGSMMARLDFKSEQVANAQVNVEGAYSRIMNANMAEEQMNASKYTILQQTAIAMLAQANQAPQSLLSLFR
jgi:flagellin